MVVKVPHSESLHLQPCLQDPGGREGWSGLPCSLEGLWERSRLGIGGEWGYLYSGPWQGRARVSGQPLSLQNRGVGWNGRGHNPVQGLDVGGFRYCRAPLGPGGPQGHHQAYRICGLP